MGQVSAGSGAITSRIAPLATILLGALACGCGADSEIAKPLCDPSQPGAGRVAIEMRTTGLVADGQTVMYDNGAPYLFVDAQCNYWVNNPKQVWDETRSGVLDADMAARLGERLHVGAWGDLAGTWSDPDGGVFDAPVLIFDDSMHAVVCEDLCDAPGVAASVKVMRDSFPLVGRELWDRGNPLVSGVRAIAVAGESGPGVPFVDWPLARPITDFVRARGNIGFGDGTLEDDPVAVQSLKELRASFLRGDHGAFVWNTLPVRSDGVYYLLYLRDTLPFEDEVGIVPLTGKVEL